MALAEYIWLDGTKPTQLLRSKTRVVNLQSTAFDIRSFPEWSFDGSSTDQAKGSDSDCTLRPVYYCKDPIRSGCQVSHYLVLCEVFDADGVTPHESNRRAELRRVLKMAQKHDPYVGFEQEYTLFNAKGESPLGWRGGEPKPQGPYYCGVGSNHIFGRNLVEEHTAACCHAGLMIYGINAEVMPGQWEFQLGFRGFPGEDSGPLAVSDQLMIARWLLHRLGEKHHIHVSLHPKPKEGDWNGAGMHTNFSTKAMRVTRREKGLKAIGKALELLGAKHQEHIEVYGADNAKRLTGEHETAPITEFRFGVADRGASVRIPRGVQAAGGGYLEDRRPGANGCPYQITARLVKTICNVE